MRHFSSVYIQSKRCGTPLKPTRIVDAGDEERDGNVVKLDRKRH